MARLCSGMTQSPLRHNPRPRLSSQHQRALITRSSVDRQAAAIEAQLESLGAIGLLRATGVTVHLVLSHATSAYMRGFYSPAKASVAANSALVQGLLLAILMRVHSLIAGGLQSDGQRRHEPLVASSRPPVWIDGGRAPAGG